MKLKRPSLLISALAAAALASALSGCAPLIIGGAAVGAMVTFDRRTSGAQLEDEGIELRAGSRLRDALGDLPIVTVDVEFENEQVPTDGKILGIVGYGTLGRAVAQVLGGQSGSPAR